MEKGKNRADEWMKKAQRGLKAAELLLGQGFSEETICLSYRAMLHAVRSLMELRGIEPGGGEELPSAFHQKVLPAFPLTKENQRALPIVKALWQRVEQGAEEGDPVTARACLEDAREFVSELGEKLGEHSGGVGKIGGEDQVE